MPSAVTFTAATALFIVRAEVEMLIPNEQPIPHQIPVIQLIGRCGTCQYAVNDNRFRPEQGQRLCKRRPPSSGPSWPGISVKDWCGEYLPVRDMAERMKSDAGRNEEIRALAARAVAKYLVHSMQEEQLGGKFRWQSDAHGNYEEFVERVVRRVERQLANEARDAKEP